jgi:hypothetical protein
MAANATGVKKDDCGGLLFPIDLILFIARVGERNSKCSRMGFEVVHAVWDELIAGNHPSLIYDFFRAYAWRTFCIQMFPSLA